MDNPYDTFNITAIIHTVVMYILFKHIINLPHPITSCYKTLLPHKVRENSGIPDRRVSFSSYPTK